MNVRIVVGGEASGTVRLLEEMLVTWGADRGSRVAVVDGREGLLDEVLRGLSEAQGVVVTPAEWTDLQHVAGVLRGLPRVIAVGLDDADPLGSGASAAWGLPVIRGRGLDGYRWAIAWLSQRLEYPFEEVAYGEHPDQIADLRWPADVGAPVPVAIFLHGGFWRERWVRDTIEPLAIDLARRGFATLNVEYRRVRDGYPGWRETASDVGAALDHLAEFAERLDLTRVVLVGHSAGAQLAAWAVHRRGLETAVRRVNAHAVVLLAGMVDLRETARRGLGDTGNPTVAFLGPTDVVIADDYAFASPQQNVPLGVAQIVVQGARDSPDLLDMARTYAGKAAAAGDEVRYLEVEDGDHFTVITPSRPEWSATVEALNDVLAG